MGTAPESLKRGEEPEENKDYDFSNLKKHDEAWTDTENRRYHRGEKLHSSLVARVESDSLYKMDVERVPRKLIETV